MQLTLDQILYRPSRYFQEIGTYSAGGVNSIAASSLKKLYPNESLKAHLEFTDTLINQSRNLEELIKIELKENRGEKISDKSLREMEKIRNLFLDKLDISFRSGYSNILASNPKLKEHLEIMMPVLNYLTEDAKTANKSEIKEALEFLTKHLEEARSKGFSSFPLFPLYSPQHNNEEKNIIKRSQSEVLKFSINQALINLAAAEGSLVNSKVFTNESLNRKSAEENLINLGNKIFRYGDVFNKQQMLETFQGLDPEIQNSFRAEYENLKRKRVLLKL